MHDPSRFYGGVLGGRWAHHSHTGRCVIYTALLCVLREACERIGASSLSLSLSDIPHCLDRILGLRSTLRHQLCFTFAPCGACTGRDVLEGARSTPGGPFLVHGGHNRGLLDGGSLGISGLWGQCLQLHHSGEQSRSKSCLSDVAKRAVVCLFVRRSLIYLAWICLPRTRRKPCAQESPLSKGKSPPQLYVLYWKVWITRR